MSLDELLLICNNNGVKKRIEVDSNANKELKAFSQEVQTKFVALFTILENEGFLKEPFVKRIDDELFEMRVKFEGQWRALYAYVDGNRIIVLSAFNKKTQKTPKQEVDKAKKRLRRYI